MRLNLLLIALAVSVCATASAQQFPDPPPESPYCARNPFNRDAAEPLPIGLTDWHGLNSQACQFERAGMPQCLRTHAQVSNNPRFWGYWVGGGTAIGGGPPCEGEGTWGWDFEGTPSRRVWLNWSHNRYQGGTGNYKTDGPKLHLHH